VHAPEFVETMKSGVGRLYRGLDRDLPRMAAGIQTWMKALAGSEEPADYFLHPVAFPLMLLPWWLERQLRGQADPDFQSDLVLSNASLYYYVRLVDNVMDGHATVEPKLLPAAGYFVERFHGLYQDHFENGHPFWDYFRRTWAEFCDVTAADGQLSDIDRQTFTDLVGRKVCAAKIGVAAVCHRHARRDLLPLWDEWIDVFGCWHLFREDMFDWQQDLNLGAVTYFLSEARRQKAAGEAEVGWLARAGLDWGFAQLDGWLGHLRRMTFASPEVFSYLQFREKELSEHREAVRPALELIRELSRSKTHE